MGVRQHPYPIKRQAFRLYAERFPVSEISRRINVPVHTLYGWVEREDWSQLRDEVTLNLRNEVTKMLGDSVLALTGAIRTSSKILSHIETQLDESLDSRGSETPSRRNELCDVAQSRSNEATPQRSNLGPKDLATLAGALKDASEVLLRVFSK